MKNDLTKIGVNAYDVNNGATGFQKLLILFCSFYLTMIIIAATMFITCELALTPVGKYVNLSE